MEPQTKPPIHYAPRTSLEEVLVTAGRFFAGDSPVHRAAHALARRLDELGIPFAVAGGLALGPYGFVRVTNDVDIIVRREDWRRFKERFVGLGYREMFAGSKVVRDTEHDVKIDVLYTGDFPGDGKPKAISFPDPTAPGVVEPRKAGGLPLVSLERLIEMKLACGLTAPHRLGKDFVDAGELMRSNALDESFAERLDPYVRAKFLELLPLTRGSPDLPDDRPPPG